MSGLGDQVLWPRMNGLDPRQIGYWLIWINVGLNDSFDIFERGSSRPIDVTTSLFEGWLRIAFGKAKDTAAA